MSKEVLKEMCESFGITEEEYLNAKKDNIERIMEFSGIDDTYRSGIILNNEDHINFCHPDTEVKSHRK